MAKFYGPIGFAEESVTNGICEEVIVEKNYRGDILKNIRKSQTSDYLLDNLDLNIKVSIVADAYANKNFFSIRYVEWMGSAWKVISVDVERPRLFLTIGGVYNGPKPEVETTEST